MRALPSTVRRRTPSMSNWLKPPWLKKPLPSTKPSIAAPFFSAGASGPTMSTSPTLRVSLPVLASPTSLKALVVVPAKVWPCRLAPSSTVLKP